MSSLRLQKRLAANVMKCGKNKVQKSLRESVIIYCSYLCPGLARSQWDQRDRQRQLQAEHQEVDQGRSGDQEAGGCPLEVIIYTCSLPSLILLFSSSYNFCLFSSSSPGADIFILGWISFHGNVNIFPIMNQFFLVKRALLKGENIIWLFFSHSEYFVIISCSNLGMTLSRLNLNHI